MSLNAYFILAMHSQKRERKTRSARPRLLVLTCDFLGKDVNFPLRGFGLSSSASLFPLSVCSRNAPLSSSGFLYLEFDHFYIFSLK